jgi:outer membrane receptor protein involved in Fe transport
LFNGLTNAAGGGANNVTQRNTSNYTLSDNLNWLKGSHAMTFGADYTRLQNWSSNYNVVPSVSIGFTTAFDPAEAIFTTANFPNSTSADRNGAKALYALLTGRVASVNGTARLNEAGDEYVYIGNLTTRSSQDDYSFFAQDVWRWKPTVTITAGLRYQYTLPLNPASSVFTTITTNDACGPSGLGAGPSADGVSPESILLAVTRYFAVSIEAIKGRSRHREVVVPRQVAMYLLKEDARLSAPDIGRLLQRELQVHL